MKLRIAQVAPLWREIPPQKYGGTERIASYLTEGLVKEDHDVTLFACGTSKTKAKLVSIYPRALSEDQVPWTNLTYPLLHITEVFDRADEFDIIHVHLNMPSDYPALPLAVPHKSKTVFTLHFPYPATPNRKDWHLILQKYKDLNYVSISDAQRQGGENLNWAATVYNGIDVTPYQLQSTPKDYFVWVGRFDPDKGAREAILAAKQAGVKLILAGDPNSDKDYYQSVLPLIDGKQVTFMGIVTDDQKNDLFGNALAFLNPIQWNEPFGLTMVEAMACGTPVIAFKNGAAPELIAEGKTGFLVKNVDEMVQRMAEIKTLRREACREHIQQHFTAEVMTKNYLAAYERILKLPV